MEMAEKKIRRFAAQVTPYVLIFFPKYSAGLMKPYGLNPMYYVMNLLKIVGFMNSVQSISRAAKR